MTDAEKASCVEWVRAHAKHWQTYRRGNWHYRWHGKTLVRFLDNVSMRELQDGLLLEYLCSPDCMETLSLYSQDVSKEWTPTSAWYEIMATRGPVNGILQIRLYHALRTDVEKGGDGPYVVEDGCMWSVSWQFYWHQTSVPPIPASSSGVNYRITNLSRDDEDGTFSYVLERRERVQQDVPEYVREVDAFKTQSREEHKGVKGDTTAGGKAASVSLGVIVTRDVSKNEDCTHDTSNNTIVSTPVVGATTETTVGLRGGSTLVVNRNMREKANEEGLEPGESVRNEQNEDLTWNQTIRSWKRDLVMWLRESCRKTIFRHTHSKTTATGTDPGFEHVVDPKSDPGKIHELDVQRTEQGWDVTDTTHEDSSVPGSVTEKRVYIDGVVKTTVNANQAAPADDSQIGIGCSVRNERTDSGLVNQTITESVPEDVGKVAEACDQTHLVHSHSETDLVGDMGDETVEATAEAGQTASIHMERTERGGYRIRRTVNTGKHLEETSVGGTTGRTVETTVHRNADGIVGGVPEPNVEYDVSSNPNDMDLRDGSVRKVVYNPETTTAKGGTQLHTETTQVVTNSLDVNPVQESVRGIIVMTNASPTGHGSANVTTTQREAIPCIEHKTWTDTNMNSSRTSVYKRKITVFRNQWEVPEIDPEYQTCHPSISINEYGLYDGVYVYSTLWDEYPTTSYGKGGGPSEQWDNRTHVTHREYSPWYKIELDDGTEYYTRDYKEWDVTVRTLFSTPKNAMQEVAEHPGFKRLGLMSKYLGGGYAMIYEEAAGGGEWIDTGEKLQRRPS